MQTRRIAMSPEDFNSFPRKLGWRYDYKSGVATIRPRQNIVVAKVELSSLAGSAPDDGAGSNAPKEAIQPTRAHLLQLLDLFEAAFGDTVEYCDVDLATTRESGRASLQGYFDGHRGAPLGFSRLALNTHGTIAGAALFVETGLGPLLDLLMVHPRHHRSGLATRLVSDAGRKLAERGATDLYSCYRLANAASAAWHSRFGFIDEPDLRLAEEKHAHFAHELERRVRSGLISLEERTRLEALVFEWKSEVETLRLIARRDGQASVAPFLRLRTSTARPSRA